MNTTIPTNWIILFGILAVVLLAVAVGFISQRKQQSKRLRQRFGAEYDRAVAELGRTKAEAELKAREKRVVKLTIIPLPPADTARFTQAWNALQGRFIDNPKGVVVELLSGEAARTPFGGLSLDGEQILGAIRNSLQGAAVAIALQIAVHVLSFFDGAAPQGKRESVVRGSNFLQPVAEGARKLDG